MTYHPLTYKCRIYPKRNQIRQFEITLEATQFLYNKLLKQYKNDYNNNNLPKNSKKYFNELIEKFRKKYFSIRNLEDSTILDISLRLRQAIQHKKDPNKIQYRYNKNLSQSFLLKDRQGFSLNKNILKLGHYGKYKLYYGKFLDYNKLISYRILYENKKWFILVTVRSNDIKAFPKTGKKVGIDLGIDKIIILSDGEKYDFPDISKVNKGIDFYNKKLSTKENNSRKYENTIYTLNSRHAHRKNIILDYYHKISTKIVLEYDFIVMEKLNIHKMIQDGRYSRSIFHANWNKLVSMIKYKCQLYDKTFIQIDTYYPSTKLCSNCGYVLEDITTEIRQWQCPKCGEIHDRDVNAAKNILNAAL